MQPGEYSSRPPSGRPPQPRQFQSIDGIARRPLQSSPPPSRPQPVVRRPLAPRRPAAPMMQPDIARPSPAPVQPQPVTPVNAVQPASPAPQPIVAPAPVVAPHIEQSAQPYVTHQFTPPAAEPAPKKQRRLKFALPRLRIAKRVVAAGLLAIIVIGASVGGYAWYSKRNAPDVVIREAFERSLQVQNITSQAVLPSGSTTTVHDFRNPKAPVTSSEATISIAGVNYGVKAYGGLSNTYIGYSELPAGVAAPLGKSLEGTWVQLRTNGQQPAGVNATLVNLSSPGFQSSGPVVFGNFTPKVRQQLLSYIQSENIYQYDPKKVVKTTRDGSSVYAYPIKLNVGFLKVLNQSAAANAGVSLSDVLKATAALDLLKDAENTLYISIGDRQILGLESVKNGTKISYSYKDANKSSAPSEPQTKVSWPAFAASHLQLQNQAAAAQTAAQRDAVQQQKLSDIHGALAVYFSQTNSYPAFTEMNNQSWIAANLPNFDPDWLHDNGGSNLALSAVPKTGVLAYQPIGMDGKACLNTALSPCAHYRLTGLASTKQPVIVQDP